MKKEIFILGDIEIGAGNLTDDFISDVLLVKTIDSFTKKKGPIDLILNGDTLDFLKCPVLNKNNKLVYPRHITAETSLNKLELMYKAHTPVFKALARFAAKSQNHIYFIIGNHDHDLFQKEVQRKIKQLLNSNKNVHFRLYYREGKVYAEHGQQYDFLNRVNKANIHLQYRGKHLLNFPWISFGLMSNFMFMKEISPFLERVKPYPILFSAHKIVLHKIVWEVVKYGFLSIFYYPIRYLRDPTYTLPRGLIAEMIRRIRNAHWDVDNIVEVFKRRRKRLLKRVKLVVLSHVHERVIEERDEWTIIHPDTWRDEYVLDEDTKMLTSKKKKYVHITLLDSGEPRWKLVEVKSVRKELEFNEVVRDQIEVIKKVAHEEGFTPRLVP